MAGMAGEFMSNWQSKYFRDRIIAQIAGARESARPDPKAEDKMEQFFAQNSPEQLEDFIYNKSHQREDYLSLVAELLMHIRQSKGKPGQGRENLNGSSEMANGHRESVDKEKSGKEKVTGPSDLPNGASNGASNGHTEAAQEKTS